MDSIEQDTTMKTNTFDIKVALIGYVSVGKSTVLNALLGDEFSQVALKRTTAGVNFFRIVQPSTNKNEDVKNEKDSVEHDGWSTIGDDANLKDANVVHDEIAKDNEELRLSSVVEEKTFDIQISHPLCKMRKDTQLVLVDIPGINEAESSKKYKEYVESKWKTFDCVVVVMDAIQGVNTQEQVDLLEFVKRNNQELKDLRTIIVVNKMDDLNDKDTIHQIEETRSKTIQIFGDVDDSYVPNIGEAVSGVTSNDVEASVVRTAFIPLSAKNAFTYMKAGGIDLDQLSNPEYWDLVSKIGQDEFGRKWTRMSKSNKTESVADILQDKSELDMMLASTNFNAFLSCLSKFVGGETCQKTILAKQIDVELEELRSGTLGGKTLSESILEVFNRSKAIGQTDAKSLQNTFWKLYTDCENDAFQNGLEKKIDPSSLVRPFEELEKYNDLTLVLQWTEESQRTRIAMKQLLRRQLRFVLDKVLVVHRLL